MTAWRAGFPSCLIGQTDGGRKFVEDAVNSPGAAGENRTRDIQLGKLTFYL